MNDSYSVKHTIILFFCILSTVACQGKPVTKTQESLDITSDTTIENQAMNANADVIYVRAEQADDGSWTFFVTVQHPDTGWEDYTDGWDIVTPDGEVIKSDPESEFTRTLLHPHVDEQPFTRSQSGIKISTDVSIARVRAHDLVDGFGGDEIFIDLTMDSGIGFEIIKNN